MRQDTLRIGGLLGELLELAQGQPEPDGSAPLELKQRLAEVGAGGMLDEAFFHQGQIYFQMADKEGNAVVCGALRDVMQAAMAERQKTLPPEYQILNQLMRARSSNLIQGKIEWDIEDPKQVLDSAECRQFLQGRQRELMEAIDLLSQDLMQQGGDGSAFQRLSSVRRAAFEVYDQGTGR